MIEFKELASVPGNNEAVYSWQSPDTGEIRMWAIQRMEKWLPSSGVPIHRAEISESSAKMFVRDRGIERHRLDYLALHPHLLTNPCIVLDLEEGTQLILDGHHRYVALAAMGYKDFIFYHLSEVQASQFEIADFPAVSGTMLNPNSYSGIDPWKGN